MIGAAQRYRELMSELLLVRELEGGHLAQTEESRFAEALDRCWHAMTDEEQAEVERSLARQQPTSTRDPGTVDQPVGKGDHTAPRRRAA